MRRGASAGLQHLRFATLEGRQVADARAEAKIRQAWPLVVGPALVRHTRLIRVHNRTLVLGCWKTEVMKHLRQSAEAVWPQLQLRLERMVKIKLQSLEVVPCDPPEPPSQKSVPEDPFQSVLRKLRTLRIRQ